MSQPLVLAFSSGGTSFLLLTRSVTWPLQASTVYPLYMPPPPAAFWRRAVIVRALAGDSTITRTLFEPSLPRSGAVFVAAAAPFLVTAVEDFLAEARGVFAVAAVFGLFFVLAVDGAAAAAAAGPAIINGENTGLPVPETEHLLSVLTAGVKPALADTDDRGGRRGVKNAAWRAAPRAAPAQI